ncbi:MAG: transporter substrate-binding domain-containing protein [Terriglobia bacterium]
MREKKNQFFKFIVLLSFCFLFTACSKEASKPGETKPKAESQSDSPAVESSTVTENGQSTSGSPEGMDGFRLVNKQWTGDFDGMVKRRLIRVLTTYSKTNFFVDLGTQRGVVYEVFHRYEEELNKKLNNKNIRVHVVFIPVAHDELIPALLEGKGDVIAAGKLVNEWRKERVDFTNPTMTHVSSVVVTGPGAPPIHSLKDLAGKELYLRPSTVSQQSVDQFNAMLAKDGLPPVKINAAPEVLADEDILEMVNAGLVPITICHGFIADFWSQIFSNLTVHKDVAVKEEGEIAWMIRKNSPQLMAELNAFITQYPEGSLQRNILLKKYLKDVKFAKGATSKKEMEKFQKAVNFIREYSTKYDLDYLLMAAQGYQESTLDQNKKSPVGAIGVMQVMPGTGKDMKVGDIRQLEPNVHAGVKYIRFMMNQYYANEPMDQLSKALFTFASYNAGPARIKSLREKAAQRNYDPNKWFNNVEIIAAESIGRETVQYVSNIYKYYLAYKMLVEQQEVRKKAKAAVASKP